jgi:dTDP-glucose 4,6-dehydratase
MMMTHMDYDSTNFVYPFSSNSKMKIIYVTGCLGFIGAYFTRKALMLGWKVFGVDKITYAANRDLLEEFTEYPNFTFLKEDIKDLNHLYDCDYVVNFAAESHVDNSILNSDQFVNSNILGVKNLNSGNKPVFFQISTDEVYGDIVDGDHIESDLLKPSNPYSASKASADMLINAWARTYGVDYLILRPTNNYGMGQYPEKLIPLSVKNLMRNRKIRLHNDGTPVRNWLHADDTAEAVLLLINSEVKNDIFNVAGGFEQSNLDTVKKIVSSYCDGPADLGDFVDFSYSRDGQDMRYALNDSKLRNLGWSPKKKFDDEIGAIVAYYKENFIW